MVVSDISERISRLKKNLFSSKYELCPERMRFYTEIYKQFPNDSENVKRAKSLAHALKNMTIFIRDDELLVGSETSKNLGEKFNLDYSRFDNSFEKKNTYKKLARRKVQPFFIDDEEIEEILEMIPFWKGKALVEDRVNSRMLKEGLITSEGMISALVPNIAIQIGTTEGHVSAGYEKLLKLGYNGILEEATKMQESLEKHNKEFKEKYDFYESVKIYYQAARDFSKRYSKLASELASNENDDLRKKELSKIAQMMDKFYSEPPSTFYEAVQFIWFSQNIANIIYQRSVVAPGRLDQILWPYYCKDLENDRITRDFALELIEELNLKLTWNVTLLPTDFTMIANAIGQNTQTITISGLDKDGYDATNELSYLFLEAYANVKAFTTDLSVRINRNTPKEFFIEAIKVFKSTSGIAFYNDEIIIPALMESGYTVEDARDYVIIGCVEPTGQGNSFAATGRMFLNLPGVLELVLNNGYSNFSKKIDGLQTGELSQFNTYEDFYDGFIQQLQYNINKSVEIAKIGDEEAMKYFQHPFISATIKGCLEGGVDHVCGGSKYNFSSITAYGFATLVDSLYNIKKFVYDEEIISLEALVNILNSNFTDQEKLRQLFINKTLKWGNNQEEIDTLANEIWMIFTSEVAKHVPLRGGRYSAGAYSMGIHVMEGLFTRPSADGRKALEAISNSLSPANHATRNGLTAALNSIAKLNYKYATNGVAVNIRMHPQNLESQENIEKFYNLLRGYFNKGGMQIQPNIVSTDTLRDAQEHPQNYLDLIVKVGGYNATFVDLGTPIQNDIIDRMEYTL